MTELLETAPQSAPVLTDRAEAYAEAIALARGHTGPLPPEWIAAQVLVTHAAADWPVLREGVSAILRRLESAREGRLGVAERPKKGVFGVYRLRQRRGGLRPYRTLLSAVRVVDGMPASGDLPVVGSCDCADFALGSLGVCKHLLTVLIDLAGKPRVWRRALADVAKPVLSGLRWDPTLDRSDYSDWYL